MRILYAHTAPAQRRVGSGRILPGGAWPGGAPPSLGGQGSTKPCRRRVCALFLPGAALPVETPSLSRLGRQPPIACIWTHQSLGGMCAAPAFGSGVSAGPGRPSPSSWRRMGRDSWRPWPHVVQQWADCSTGGARLTREPVPAAVPLGVPLRERAGALCRRVGRDLAGVHCRAPAGLRPRLSNLEHRVVHEFQLFGRLNEADGSLRIWRPHTVQVLAERVVEVQSVALRVLVVIRIVAVVFLSEGR